MPRTTTTGWQVIRMAWSTPREILNSSLGDTSHKLDWQEGRRVGREKGGRERERGGRERERGGREREGREGEREGREGKRGEGGKERGGREREGREGEREGREGGKERGEGGRERGGREREREGGRERERGGRRKVTLWGEIEVVETRKVRERERERGLRWKEEKKEEEIKNTEVADKDGTQHKIVSQS